MGLGTIMEHFSALGQPPAGKWWGWPLGGIGASWLGGLWAQVDGTHAVNLIALGILGIGSSVLGLWRLYEVQQIKVWEERVKARIRMDEERARARIRTDEEQRASAARVPLVAIVSPGASPHPQPVAVADATATATAAAGPPSPAAGPGGDS